MTERLFQHFQANANARGLVLRSETRLLEELECSRESLVSACDRLVADGRLEVLAPFPFLVAKLPGSWPDKRQNDPKNPHSAYRYSKLLSNQSDESYSQPPRDELLHEILDTLGTSDPSTFQGAIERYRPEVIRRALERVRQTRSIRKNRIALFRYLLTKLS